jgi:hypothetical protein
LKKQLNDLLSEDLIRIGVSPWEGALYSYMFTTKRNGSWQKCVDYHALSAKNIQKKYKLPFTKDLFDQLNGAKVFSKIDSHSGYNQICARGQDIENTASSTKYGNYERKVMCSRLTNVRDIFMETMKNVLHRFLENFLVVFTKLVYSKEEVHERHVRLVLKTPWKFICKANEM